MAGNAALALLLDDRAKYEVEKLRWKHDKTFDSWPAHVNLLWPLVPPKEARERMPLLTEKLEDFPSFQLSLTRLTHAPSEKVGCKNHYLHFEMEAVVRPPSPLAAAAAATDRQQPPEKGEELQQICSALYPEAEPRKLHLTVGQVDEETAAALEAKYNDLPESKQLSFTAKAVTLLTRKSISSAMAPTALVYLQA